MVSLPWVFVAQCIITLEQSTQAHTNKQNLCSVFFFQQQTHFYDDFNFTEKENQVLQNLPHEIEMHDPFLQSVQQAATTNQHMSLYKLIISDVPPVQHAQKFKCTIQTGCN